MLQDENENFSLNPGIQKKNKNQDYVRQFSQEFTRLDFLLVSGLTFSQRKAVNFSNFL